MAEAASKLPACGFSVSGGKKGSVPVSVEKRPKGKKVTIISNVQGSAKSLLSALSSLLGCGGTLRQEASGVHWTVEIQGDQVDRVATALQQLGCLRGVKKDVESKQEKKKAVEVERVCAYDKFLRRGEPEKKNGLASQLMNEAYAAPCLPGAECFKWHGAWVYCRGRCEQTDLSDVWVGDLRDDPSLDRPSYGVDLALPQSGAKGAELDAVLRRLGMLAEVGEAARTWGRNAGGSSAASASGGGRQGSTLAEYRRACIAPGARLIEWEPDGGKKTAAARRANSRAASRSARGLGNSAGTGGPGVRSKSCEPSKRPAAPARRAPAAPAKPPRLGCFPCPFCGSMFGLHKTLKLHVRNVHPGQQCPRPGAAAPVHMQTLLSPAVSLVHGHVPGMDPGGWSNEPPPPVSSRAPPSAAPRWAAPGGGHAVEKKAPVPRAAAAADQRAPSKAKKAKSPPPKRSSPCPICFDTFPQESIEAHVELCLAASQAAPVSSDSESEGDVGGFVPAKKTGGGSHTTWLVLEDFEATGKNQLSVRRGDRVVVVWEQPPKEGGYWAYGFNELRRRKVGYVPLEHLAVLDDEPSTAALAPSPPVRDEEEASAAVDDAGDWCPPEAWLESFLLLDLRADKADEFWANFAIFRQEMSMESAWLKAFGQACEEGSSDQKATKGPADPAGHAGHAFETVQRREEVRKPAPAPDAALRSGDVREVWVSWEPTCEQAVIQLRAPAGSRFTVEWRQPEAEGGYWAYGRLDGSPEPGYVPIHCLGPCKGPSGEWQTSTQPAATEAAALQPAATQPDATSGGGRGPWRRRHAAAAAAQASEPALQGAGGDGGKGLTARELEEWAQGKLEALARRFCLGSLDVAVAFTALSICTSAAEMRLEAVLLIADNAPVKNFADELWRRRCSLVA